MKLTFTNETATLKDGKRIAFAVPLLHIDGVTYPVKLSVIANGEQNTRKDRAKLNAALVKLGFKIGVITADEVVDHKEITLKGE